MENLEEPHNLIILSPFKLASSVFDPGIYFHIRKVELLGFKTPLSGFRKNKQDSASNAIPGNKTSLNRPHPPLIYAPSPDVDNASSLRGRSECVQIFQFIFFLF